MLLACVCYLVLLHHNLPLDTIATVLPIVPVVLLGVCALAVFSVHHVANIMASNAERTAPPPVDIELDATAPSTTDTTCVEQRHSDVPCVTPHSLTPDTPSPTALHDASIAWLYCKSVHLIDGCQGGVWIALVLMVRNTWTTLDMVLAVASMAGRHACMLACFHWCCTPLSVD
jgi:hypothetical protein